MRCCINPVGPTGDHRDIVLRQLSRPFPRNPLSVTRACARPHDGNRTQRHQSRIRLTPAPQSQWSMGSEFIHPSRPLAITRDNNTRSDISTSIDERVQVQFLQATPQGVGSRDLRALTTSIKERRHRRCRSG